MLFAKENYGKVQKLRIYFLKVSNFQILQNVPIYPVTNSIEKTVYNSDNSIVSDSISESDDKASDILENITTMDENMNFKNLVRFPPWNEAEETLGHSKDISRNVTNNYSEIDDYKSNLSIGENSDDTRDKDFNIAEYSSDTTSESSESDISNHAFGINIISKPTSRPLSEEIKKVSKYKIV